MARPLSFVRLDIAHFGIEISDRQDDKTLADWVRKFHRALALQDSTLCEFASKLLNECAEFRAIDANRKRIPKDSTGIHRKDTESTTDQNITEHSRSEEESPVSPSGILDIPGKVKKPKTIFPDNSEPMEFADLYRRMYADWTRGTGKPPTPDKLQSWAGVFDAMMRIDGYSSYEIERMMNAIDKEQPGKDGFCWKHVLLSPEKLRKRWGEGKLYKFKKEALNGQVKRH